MKTVLVIIPHYNKIKLIKECLSFLFKQTTNDFDILVIDNGSTDNSNKYLFELSKKNDNIHTILLNDNMGFAYAVNKGFEYAIKNNYTYSILLNNDAFVEKDFVKALIDKMNIEKNLFAAQSLMINYHNQEVIDSFGDGYNLFGFSSQNHIDERVEFIERDEDCFSACGGASIYRNDILKKIGMLDDKFFAYLEDIDLSYRARINGYKVSTCKNARCYHLGSATSGSRYNSFKVRISARNNIYLIYKNMPILMFLINLTPLFFGIIVKQLFFIFKGFGKDYFIGVLEGIFNAHNLKKTKIENATIYTKFFRYLSIEWQLITNTILYAFNFLKRHIK